MSDNDIWDELIDDEPEIDDLKIEIALAELNLARLKAARAMRELAKACAGAADCFRALADNHVLNSQVIED